jgi:hypothetical protein
LRISDVASQKILQYQSQNQNTLSLGDIFTGRILAAKSGYLLMQLMDGSEIYAQVKLDDTYNAGDVLKLKVIDRQQNGSVMTQVEEHISYDKANAQAQISPESLLKSLELPITEQGLEIVKAIIEMGEKPSKELVEKALKLMENSHIEQPKHAVFLVVNGFEENEQYHSLLSNLDDGTFHFADKLIDFVNTLQQSEDENLFFAAEQIKALPRNTLVKPNQEQETMVEQWVNALNSEFATKDGMLTLPANEFKSILKNVFSKTGKSDLPKLELWMDELQREFATEDGTISLPIEKLKSEMQNLIEPDETGIPKVEQWIDELQKQLDSIDKYISSTTDLAEHNTNNIQATVKELQNAIHFFNDISSFEMFIQLPLTIRGEKTSGELYVMKRKGRAGKISPKDFSFFLSLTTENIGILDIFINVKDKNVIAKLTADDEKYKPLFMSEYKILHEALQKKGFNLFELSILPRKEKLDIFNAEQTADLLMTGQKARIDIKV